MNTVKKKRKLSRKTTVLVMAIFAPFAIIGVIVAAKLSTVVTINGVEYRGKTVKEAEALYDKEMKEKAEYVARQREECRKKSGNYMYIADDDVCVTYDEFLERKRLKEKRSYQEKQQTYKNNPTQEVIDAYNNYELISSECRDQIMHANGYSDIREVASGDEQPKITKDNIVSIDGDTVKLRIDVEYVPGFLVEGKPELRQQRASMKGQICTVNMQKDYRDRVESYING